MATSELHKNSFAHPPNDEIVSRGISDRLDHEHGVFSESLGSLDVSSDVSVLNPVINNLEL